MAININKKTSPEDLDSSQKGDIPINTGSDIVALPVGTDGQIIEADSSQAEGVRWVDKSTTTGVKGDLLTYSTTPTILPIGSEGNILTVASATAEGMEWAPIDGINLTEVKTITTTTIDKTATGGTFVSGMSGVIDFIGTSEDTVAYVNPTTTDEIDVFDDGIETDTLTDKNYGATNNIISTDLVIDLKRDAYAKITEWGARYGSTGSLTLEGSNNGIDYTVIDNNIIVTASPAGSVQAVTTNSFYRYFRLTPNAAAVTILQLEVFGEIIPTSPIYNLVDEDNNKLLLVPFGNATQLNVPTGLGANGFTCQITGTVSAAHPITINPLPGVTFVGQNFVIDNVGEVATIYQISTDVYAVSISRGKLPLTTKGDILVHDGNEPVRRSIGSDNTVLTADSAESTGVAWKDINTIVSSPFTSQRLDLTATLQLTSSNARYLYLSAPSAIQDVILTNPPSPNDFFYIVNRDPINPIQIKETVAGGVVQVINSQTPVAQCHYDGTDWQIISLGTI